MQTCSQCNKPKPKLNYNYPSDIREEKTYCTCIPWETLIQCAELSILNAERYIDDSEILIRENSLASAKALIVLGMEELGKAIASIEYISCKKDMRREKYKDLMLSHTKKMNKLLEFLSKENLNTILYGQFSSNDLTGTLQELKLNSLYVDYRWNFRQWIMPWSSDPRGILVQYGLIINDYDEARELRALQSDMDKIHLSELFLPYVKSALEKTRDHIHKEIASISSQFS